MDAVTTVPEPANEPVRTYAPGTAERASLLARLQELRAEHVELTSTIGGSRRMASGERFSVVEPHRHASVLGTSANATDADVADAVAAAKAAAPAWAALPFDERAAVFLRAADLLAGPWRDTLNAATMLGQSKSVQQAEIDAACELIDFLRFNVHYARRVIAEQPRSAPGEWNRMDWRPLDGFVTAITPFNFTAIAGNLPTVPALMGNTVVWKPTPTQQVAAHHTMRLLEAAGLPAGVINMVTGDGLAVSRVALTDPDMAGLHFTGSSATFKTLWRTVADNLDRYRSYPRIVGETGGKDFVVVHPSADPAPLTTALVRGAFEYQGQKCSAASRAYVPRSIWQGGLREELADVTRVAALRRRRRPDQLRRRRHRRPRVRPAPARAGPGQAGPVAGDPRRRWHRRQRGLVRRAHRAGRHRPGRRGVRHRVLRPDPRRARLRRQPSTPTRSTSSTAPARTR